MFIRAASKIRSFRPAVLQYKTMATSTSAIPADVVPLTEAHKAAVLATAPIMAQHGVAITRQMYKTMLEGNKSLKDIFSYTAQTTGVQPVALAQSIYAYAANINDLSPLLPTVVRIAEKHAALGVKAEHYGVVAANLMPAITHVLGDAFTPELQQAWYHAYWQLAKIFIDVEADMYAKGAWDGWKEFQITKHVDESGSIASFSLVPTEASMLPLKPFKAGQFVTVRVWIEELNCYQNRHYSISDASTPDHYRITVKREDGNDTAPEGIVSSRLHSLPTGSTVQVAFPLGSFVLPEAIPENVVLFSAGVGITPNLAILNTLAAENPAAGPSISWIQGVRNPSEHVFKSHVADLAERSDGKIRTAVYYSEVKQASEPGIHGGRLNVNELDQDLLALDKADTIYYVCGPDQFMRDVRRDLAGLGIDSKRVVYEAFHAGEL